MSNYSTNLTDKQWKVIEKIINPQFSTSIRPVVSGECCQATLLPGQEESRPDECPSVGIIDSRSLNTSHPVDSDSVIDGNKTVKGRKEHIVVENAGVLRWI